MELFRHSLYFFLSLLALAALSMLFIRLEHDRRKLAIRILGKQALLGRGVLLRRRLRFVFAISGLFFLIASICVPQWGVELAPAAEMRGSLVVAVDVSFSMAAKDLKPSRLEHAKMLINELASRFAEYRIGILAFAGKAYMQCPFTDDSDAIDYFASQLRPGMLPVQGTNFSSVIDQALAMTAKTAGTKVLVLITDGEDHSKGIEFALKSAKEADLRIFPVGLGSAEGDLVPLTDSMGNTLGYKKDKNGKPILSRLGEALLMRLAAETGSAYVRYSAPDNSAEALLSAINRLKLEKTKGKSRAAFKNRYQWPLTLAFILFLVELVLMDTNLLSSFRFKKAVLGKKLASLLAAFVLFLISPSCAIAASAKAFAREGNKLFKSGDFNAAAKKYEKAAELAPNDGRMFYNLGAAQYKSGDIKSAKETYEKIGAPKGGLKIKSEFNKANILYKSGDTNGAIAAWKNVLRLDPDNENAKFNLQKILAFPKPPPCQKPKDNDKSKNNDKKDNKSGGQDNKNSNAKQKPEDKNKQAERNQQKLEDKKKQQERKQAEQLLRMMSEKEKSDAEKKQAEMRRANAGRQERAMQEDW